MAKVNIIRLVPPTDKRFKEGWSIAVQPQKPAEKKPAPKKPQGKK